jgi:hypothetical protein
MSVSMNQAINAMKIDETSKTALRSIVAAIIADNNAMAAQFNQLRTDYNANANIVTDTTATAVSTTLST